MGQSLAISITLCHQFKSRFYNTQQLKTCIQQATQLSEEMLDNINMVFEDIEDAMHDNQVHENVTASIRKSHIIIFEISDLNHNVVYELGIANALKKPIIILREDSSVNELPSDINQFIYLTYDKNNMEVLTNKLAKRIKKAYNSYDETDFISNQLKEKVVDKYIEKNPIKIFSKLDKYGLIKVLKSKKDFKIAFEQILASTKINFYYIGTMGFLSTGDQWFDLYSKYFEKDKVFSRIVYLQTLKEFHTIYDDEEMLVNYCLWLVQNYYLLKHKIISISLSKDVGIWKNGISIVVSDEEKLMVSTGAFTSMYNSKGFLIDNGEISQMFKEYAKVLALKSKNIKPRQLMTYLSFNEKLKNLPREISDALENKNFKELKTACEKYVYECLDEE